MSDTLKSLVVNLIGNYQPNSYFENDVEIIPSGLAGVDVVWLMSALLFGLSFYCVFRLVGVILNAIRNK